MALVPVRHAQPIDGEQPIAEVSEEWLARWPEDFVRLEGEDLARYELGKAGVPASQIEELIPAVLAVAAASSADEEALGAVVAEDSETPTVDPSVV